MKTLTLNIPDSSDYDLLIKLLNRMGIRTNREAVTKNKKTMKQLYSLMDSVKKNELFKEISDPTEWQNKLRNEWT
jgi:uncharacterized protein YjgD (DUF1641 family)